MTEEFLEEFKRKTEEIWKTTEINPTLHGYSLKEYFKKEFTIVVG